MKNQNREHQSALSILVAKDGDHPREPGSGDGYYLYPDGPRFRVPERRGGMGYTEGVGLAAVDHAGCRALPGSAAGSDGEAQKT